MTCWIAWWSKASSGPSRSGGRATELVGRRWRYDAAGRPTSIDDDRWGTTTYGYDPLGQLIEAKRGGYHEVFEYNVTGSLQNILGSLCRVLLFFSGGVVQVRAMAEDADLRVASGLPRQNMG